MNNFTYIGGVLASVELFLAILILLKPVYHQKKQNLRLFACLLYMGFV